MKAEAMRQHPEETLKEIESRIMYRKKHLRRAYWRKWRKPLLLAAAVITAVALLALSSRAQNPNVNIDRVGGTPQTTDTFKVNCVSGCAGGAGGGTATVDGAAFTAGVTSFTAGGGIFNDTAGLCASGTGCFFRITASRAVHINLRDASGTEIGTSGAPLRTDPTGTTTQPVSCAAAANCPVNASQVGGPWTVNLTQWAGGTLGALSNYGTSPGAVLAPGVNAFITNIPHVIADTGSTTAVTGNVTVVQSTAANLNATVSGTVTTSPPANASSNVAQINGITPLMGNGTTGTGSPRVTIASDNTAFTVNAAESGTWTVQPGNTANTTPWKVDGSAVTQPVSGTVNANQGTANSAANAWFAKLTDGTNTQAVKAASTAAAATDPSAVIQLSPNQPQLTTPLNVQGGKTNNNAAPGANNEGGLNYIANASPPSYTEGNQVAGNAQLNGVPRVTLYPPNVLGCWALNSNVGYTATTQNGIIFSLRWGDATHLALVMKVQVHTIATAFTTAGLVERQLVVVRGFTASDTGGTALTPAANQNELRTSFPTSLLTDARIGGFLTAGTGTADTNPLSSVAAWMAGVGTVIGGGQPVTLFDAAGGQYPPLTLAQNEGFRIRLGAAETASTRQTFVNIVYCEANAY